MRIVSYSEVTKYQTCIRQYYYRYSLGLVPIEGNSTIGTGVEGHDMLKTFWRAIRDGATREEAKEAILDEIGPPNLDMLKAWTMVDNYIKTCDIDIETVFVEEPFIIPVSEEYELAIGFTPDLVIRRKGGYVDIEDVKFIQRQWSFKKLNRYSQLRLYIIFLEQMGFKVSRAVLRMFNVNTGKVSVKTYIMGEEEKRIIRRDFLTEALKVKEFKEQPVALQGLAPRTLNYNQCHFCDYEFVCGLESEGKDASRSLATLYTGDEYGYES